MIEVKFKNLEPSELAREAVYQRVGALVEKFEDLQESRLVVTLEMQNSPLQAGPDLFVVHLQVSRGRFAGTRLKKSDANLYRALAEVVDHMLELTNRAGDKKRIRQRNQGRKTIKEIREKLLE